MRQEKKLNNSVEPVNILGTQTILHQKSTKSMEQVFFVKFLLEIMSQSISL